MTRRQYTQSGLTVPYITTWSRERHITPPLERRTGRQGPYLAYRDETAYDRHHGTLWIRQPMARGKGRALLQEVHALRQRQCMTRLLCQVCATDCVEATGERQLFLMRDTGRPITEGERTTSPPVCPSCVPPSVQDCPHLRAGCSRMGRVGTGMGCDGHCPPLQDPRTALHQLRALRRPRDPLDHRRERRRQPARGHTRTTNRTRPHPMTTLPASATSRPG